MDIQNISNQRLGLVEQLAQRYALMAFEVHTGLLAVGRSSIRYFYGEPDLTIEGCENFVALFIEWNTRKKTVVTFHVEDSGSKITLSKGSIKIIEDDVDNPLHFADQKIATPAEWYGAWWVGDSADSRKTYRNFDFQSPQFQKTEDLVCRPGS